MTVHRGLHSSALIETYVHSSIDGYENEGLHLLDANALQAEETRCEALQVGGVRCSAWNWPAWLDL